MAWDAGAAGQGTGHVVAVCNLKGGTGKSTLSVNIACALATRGIGVALVDNDRQASATLWGSAGKLPITCLSLPLARLEDARPWLEVLLGLRAHYQVVIVDFPAGLPPGLWPTVLLASLILVPTSPNEIEIVATRSMLQRITVLRAARASNPPALLVVPNRIVGAENGPQGYRARLAVLGEELAPPARFRPRTTRPLPSGSGSVPPVLAHLRTRTSKPWRSRCGAAWIRHGHRAGRLLWSPAARRSTEHRSCWARPLPFSADRPQHWHRFACRRRLLPSRRWSSSTSRRRSSCAGTEQARASGTGPLAWSAA